MKPKALKLLIWNDSNVIGAQWATVAKGDGFETDLITSPSESEIVAKYREARPDAVLLDLVDDKIDVNVGLEFGKRLLAVDPLATVIVLTRKPSAAYRTDGYLRWKGFAGVYPAELAVPEQLRENVVMESLLMKHLLQPDFALARSCVNAIDSIPDWGGQAVTQIRNAVQMLPLAGNMDSWHKILSDAVAEGLRERGWTALANRLVLAANLFEDADPFYMAGSRSRKHLSHNVQVCLLGWIFLLADSPIRSSAVADMGSLLDAFLVWACIGLVHDAAYLCQHLDGVSEVLSDLSKRFSPFVGGHSPIAYSKWPAVHHATVGSRMWEASPGVSKEEAHALTRVSIGIASHDLKQNADRLSVKEWHRFLAVLADELQDWQRLRNESAAGIEHKGKADWKDAPWRVFEPMCLDVVRTVEHGTIVRMQFIVADHASPISVLKGSPDVGPIADRFDEILKTIGSALYSTEQMRIELGYTVVTRPVTPLTRWRQLETS